jgi:gas vesicle protein
MSTGKVLLGLLAGVAAGALLGVLFAPDKGTVTRKKIARKSDEYADGLTEKFNEFLDTLSEKFDDVKDEVGKVKSKAEAVKKDVKSATT